MGAVGDVGAAAINAGSSMATTIATNQANKNIAQMNNEFNMKMLDKQIAYNKEAYQTQLGDTWKFYNDNKQNQWDMFNATNEYNSASAQRQRFEEAGLNPQLMMQGQGAGMAQSSGISAPSVSSMQGISTPTATPYTADYNGITQALGQSIDMAMRNKSINADANLKKQETENLRIEGQYIAAKNIAGMYKMYNDAKNDTQRTQIAKMISDYQKNLMNAQTNRENEQASLIKVQAAYTMSQKLMADKQLSFMDDTQRMQLSSMAADIALKRSQRELTDKQAAHEVEKLAETVVRADNQQLQNQFDADTYKTRVNTLKASLIKMINEDIPFAPADIEYLWNPPRKKIKGLSNLMPE